jgi:hypothetical protein
LLKNIQSSQGAVGTAPNEKKKFLSFSRQLTNCIKGINQGFTINLKLEGIGYNAEGDTKCFTQEMVPCFSLRDSKEKSINFFAFRDLFQTSSKKKTILRPHNPFWFPTGKKTNPDKLWVEKKKISGSQDPLGNELDFQDILKVLRLNLGFSHSLAYKIP